MSFIRKIVPGQKARDLYDSILISEIISQFL